MYIQFIMGEMKNVELSIEEISELERRELPLTKNSILYHLKEILDEDIFQQRKGVHVDLESYLSYEKYEISLRVQITLNIKQYMQLWEVLMEKKATLTKVKHFGLRIQKSEASILLLCQNIMKINPAASQISKLYAHYIAQVFHDDFYSRHIIEK